MEGRSLALRDEIDQIDQEILELLGKRARCALEMGEHKRAGGLPLWDPLRERDVLDELRDRCPTPLPHTAVDRIFSEIISACRSIQAPFRVACLGPEGTFTHLAATRGFGGSCDYLLRGSILEVFRAVERDEAQSGVVPVENSLEGAVNLTLDALESSDLQISGEILCRISHALLSREDRLSRVTKVLSHPQALAQCRRWLDANLPGRHVSEASSTAEAARQAAHEPGTAAIASETAAESYGLGVLAREIQDQARNLTRFLILGKAGCRSTGNDKTSILFSTGHRPGALFRALEPLAEEGINLTRIESRPSRGRPWEYIFFVDLEGHASDAPQARALNRLGARVDHLRVLGSYPRGAEHG